MTGSRCTWKGVSSPKGVSIGTTEVTVKAGKMEMGGNYNLWHLFSPWNIKQGYFLKHETCKNWAEI